MIKRFFIVVTFIFCALPSTVFAVVTWPPFWDDTTVWVATTPGDEPNATTVTYYSFGDPSALTGLPGIGIATTPTTTEENTYVMLAGPLIELSTGAGPYLDVVYNFTALSAGTYTTGEATDFVSNFCVGVGTVDHIDDLFNRTSGDFIWDGDLWIDLGDPLYDGVCFAYFDNITATQEALSYLNDQFDNILPYPSAEVRPYIVYWRSDENEVTDPEFLLTQIAGMDFSEPYVPPAFVSTTASYFLLTYQNDIILTGIFFTILALARPLTTVFRSVYNQYKKDTYI